MNESNRDRKQPHDSFRKSNDTTIRKSRTTEISKKKTQYERMEDIVVKYKEIFPCASKEPKGETHTQLMKFRDHVRELRNTLNNYKNIARSAHRLHTEGN